MSARRGSIAFGAAVVLGYVAIGCLWLGRARLAFYLAVGALALVLVLVLDD